MEVPETTETHSVAQMTPDEALALIQKLNQDKPALIASLQKQKTDLITDHKAKLAAIIAAIKALTGRKERGPNKPRAPKTSADVPVAPKPGAKKGK